MILYKEIVLRFGHYCESMQPTSMIGLDGQQVSAEDIRRHWQCLLGDIAAARIYLLDHNAANYLDSLRINLSITSSVDSSEIQIQSYVRDVEFPRELIWVEYDDRMLWEDRVERGVVLEEEAELNNRTQRGFLFDNRSDEFLSVRMFNALTEKSFLDAPLLLEISKDHSGRPDFNNLNWILEKKVLAGLIRGGLLRDEATTRDFLEEHKGHVTYEMVIGFMLFAALSVREDDLVLQKERSLTTAQSKTARKFGKVWMTDTLKSHVTIRIGPTAERHMAEQKARLRFEAMQAVERAAPIEHWVAAHERRYANGKIVWVRAHKRGQAVDRNIPARIVGPKKA